MGDMCDVIVVGAGLVGATAALLLADYGLKCTVVEARRAPQSHPAARNEPFHTASCIDSPRP